MSKMGDLLHSLHPIAILIVSFISSLLIATNLRCHEALSYHLRHEFSTLATPSEFRWLGFTGYIVTHMLLPLCAGMLDTFHVNYRVSSIVAGGLMLLGSLLSAGVSDPGYLIITDTIIVSLGSAILLSTLVLIMDDYFDERSSLRILATTFVQGTTIGTFFFVDGYVTLIHNVGWRYLYCIVGVTSLGVCLIAASLFTRRRQSAYRDLNLDVNVVDVLRGPGSWKKHILGVNQEEFASSSTTLFWFLERYLAALITDGIFFYLLKSSGISQFPLVETTSRPAGHPRIIIALIYSVGSSVTYIVGAFLGCMISGSLLVVYMVGCFVNFCSLLSWLFVVEQNFNAEMVFVAFCGLGVGTINTFAFAASQEATGISARHIYPFTRIFSGLSCITLQLAIMVLESMPSRPLYVVNFLFVFLSVAELIMLVVIKQIRSKQSSGSQKSRQLIVQSNDETADDSSDEEENIPLTASLLQNEHRVLATNH